MLGPMKLVSLKRMGALYTSSSKFEVVATAVMPSFMHPA